LTGGCGRSRSRSRLARAGRGASESVSLPRKWLVLGFRLHIFFFVLYDFHVYLLAVLHVHNRERSTSLSDSIEDLCIPWVIRAIQISIIDREPVRPEVESPLHSSGKLRSRRDMGRFNHFTRGFVSTESPGGTSEV